MTEQAIACCGLPGSIAEDILRYWHDEAPIDAVATVCIYAQAQEASLPECDHYIKLANDNSNETLADGHVRLSAPVTFEAITAHIRRLLQQPAHSGYPLAGDWHFHPASKSISHPDKERLYLTDKESALLTLLLGAQPHQVDKEQILEHVWGYDAAIDTHTLETHIYRLRQKMDAIAPQRQTEYGIVTDTDGYRWQS